MTSQLSNAEECERQRIAGELHDEVGQNLALARMQLRSVVKAASDPGVVEKLEELSTTLMNATRDTRRLVYALSSRRCMNWVLRKRSRSGSRRSSGNGTGSKPGSLNRRGAGLSDLPGYRACRAFWAVLCVREIGGLGCVKMVHQRWRGYLLSMAGWIVAVLLFLLIRLAGFKSPPQFQGSGLSGIDHGVLFVEGMAIGWLLGSLSDLRGPAGEIRIFSVKRLGLLRDPEVGEN